MGRIAWLAVALVLLTAVPAAQAGLLSSLVEDAAKAGAKGAEDVAKSEAKVRAHGVKVENKVGGLEATGASVEANVVKVETMGGGGGGDDAPPVWFVVLCVVAVGGWLLSKFRGKIA
jgi:hypothetical protein